MATLEHKTMSASQIIAVLLQRLGGEQYISQDEIAQFETRYPTLLTVNPDNGAVKCEVAIPENEQPE